MIIKKVNVAFKWGATICAVLTCFIASAQVLKVGAIDWCPQICLNEAEQGYVIDTIEQVYRDSDFTLDISYYPWSRAIKSVREGKLHVLLSPAKDEAPDLYYPDEPIGYQQMCFFVEKSNPWRYQGVQSLKGKTIGLAVDASIEELNASIATLPEVFKFQPYHERFIKQNAGMVLKHRLDGFIFTRNTTRYELKKLGLLQEFKLAGCVSKVPIYAAFTHHEQTEVDIKQAVLFFDKKMKHLKQNGFIEAVKEKYGIEK